MFKHTKKLPKTWDEYKDLLKRIEKGDFIADERKKEIQLRFVILFFLGFMSSMFSLIIVYLEYFPLWINMMMPLYLIGIGIIYYIIVYGVILYKETGSLNWMIILFFMISIPIFSGILIELIGIETRKDEKIVWSICALYLLVLTIFYYAGGIDRILIWRNQRKSKKLIPKSVNQKE